LPPVALLPELADVVAQLLRVAREVRALELDVVRVDGIEVRLDRDLRVDDDRLPARKLHDEIRTQQRSLVVANALLRAKVAVVEHSGELDDALQLQLAPAAAHVGRAERGDEAARLAAQLLLAVRDLAQALADRGHLAGALLLELPRLELELGERLLDRRELRLGELEERRLALQERRARPEVDGCRADGEPEDEKDRCHGPTDGRDPVGRQKISPGESEDLPGLSAGSDDSEELPDPTGGT